MARYRDYNVKDLSPALGAIRLEELTYAGLGDAAGRSQGDSR
jgi:hypothetical protein